MNEKMPALRKNPETKLIFIVGAPRSGTTLLAEMLSSHPDICSSPETHYYSRHAKKYSWTTRMVKSKRIRHFETVMRDIGSELFGFSAADLQEVGRRHADLRRDMSSGLLAQLLKVYSMKNNKPICCEKTPMHIKYVEQILKEIPCSCVVCIHRDPRDVWLSVRKTPWNTGNALYHAIFWRRIASISEKWARTFPKRYLEVKFEDLVAEPRAVLEPICEFVQVGFSTEMVQWYLRGEATFSTATEPWKSNAKRPLDARRRMNWKKEMCCEDSALFEAVAGKQMRRLHYTVTSLDSVGYGKVVAKVLAHVPYFLAAVFARLIFLFEYLGGPDLYYCSPDFY
jgi:Sulfotransferase family